MDKKTKWRLYNKYKMLVDLFWHFVMLGVGGIIGTLIILPFIETLSIFSIIWFGFCTLLFLIFMPLKIIVTHKRDSIWREIKNDD